MRGRRRRAGGRAWRETTTRAGAWLGGGPVGDLGGCSHSHTYICTCVDTYVHTYIQLSRETCTVWKHVGCSTHIHTQSVRVCTVCAGPGQVCGLSWWKTNSSLSVPLHASTAASTPERPAISPPTQLACTTRLSWRHTTLCSTRSTCLPDANT